MHRTTVHKMMSKNDGKMKCSNLVKTLGKNISKKTKVGLLSFTFRELSLFWS